MIFEFAVVFIFILIIYNLFIYKKLHYNFKKHGIKYKPGLPIFGNNFGSTFALTHITEDLDEVYKAFPDEKYVGYMEGMKSIILVRDPELMKSITIKDFDHFVNRKAFFPKEIEPLLGSSLLSMKDETWRKMRARLSLAFSSSKIKAMVPFIVEIANNITDYLKDHQNEVIDVTDLMRRFNTDVIASTGFGLQINSLRDRNNKFFKIGKEAIEFSFSKWLFYFLTTQFPPVASIMQSLGIQLFSMEGVEFFRNIVADTIKYRKKHNITRFDFIHLLMEHGEDWTLDEITGQIFFAFMASFDSSSSNLTMTVHELALQPHYQEQLYQEIIATKEKYGEVTSDSIAAMKFLDCVLNETSRKWSIALMMDRVCTKNYILPPANEGAKPYVLRPGDVVYNVVNSVHMDEKHHPDPHAYRPERFSDVNKQNIKSFTFMPFGMGPRSCIAMRFATLKMKILLYHLVLNYKIVKCPKTADHIRMQPHQFNVKAVGETYVQFEPRH